jgi:hypothetical protein
LFGGLLERCVYRKIAGSDLPDWAFTCFCKIDYQPLVLPPLCDGHKHT